MNKRTVIFQTAIRLFAIQGYESTTTLQIAREVGVTEPAVFYYFKSKNGLFSTLLEEAGGAYQKRIEGLDLDACAPFGCLVSLIGIHFAVIAEETDLMRILLRTCPVKLADPDSTCTRIYRRARSTLKSLVVDILEKGVASGQFNPVDIDPTANMLIAMLNGLMRQQVAAMDRLKGVEEATVEFCRKALMVRH